MAPDARSRQKGTKRPRTRHGCVNCKTKRRKCDEAKPTCGRCSNKDEQCEWAPRLIFRAENALGVAPSVLRRAPGRVPTRFRIKDVTAEIIRDYQHDAPGDEVDLSDDQQAPASNDLSPSTAEEQNVPFRDDLSWQQSTAFANGTDRLTHLPSQELCHLPAPGDVGSIWHSPLATGLLDENVFLPGSAYLDAHSTFRNHLIQEVRSTVHTREVTPDTTQNTQTWQLDTEYDPIARRNDLASLSLPDTPIEDLNFSPTSTLELSDEEEFVLWKNWVDEIAPWVDKFDSERHFQHTLPIMARSHDHLRYSMLAVSARQLERKNHSKHTERSLALYQTAIQLVLPQLHMRSTPVIASCVVLCVLEMLSSSAKAWHQHLDGCAHLIEAIGINGFSGGVNQALFWCFARMDVCGGLIASSKTLIPVEHWASGIDLDADVDLFQAHNGYNAHACQAVYPCAQVLDLLSFHTGLAERTGASPPSPKGSNDAYLTRWQRLWRHISSWYTTRPAEMLPISSIATSASPFPRLLYSNPAAMSGNQLYHTASVIMLRHKPSGVIFTSKPQSIFWHARQICGISTSNDHHGAWTNAIQPLWIAGQWMSHESEQKAILELLERIETETGWGTKWRAEDLKDFWG